MHSRSVLSFRGLPRGDGTLSPCFCRPVAINGSILFFSRARTFSSDQYPASASTDSGRVFSAFSIDVTAGCSCCTSGAAGVTCCATITWKASSTAIWGVVALDEPVVGLLDLRLRVGEVPLRLRRRLGFLGVLPLGRGFLSGLGFQRRLRLADLLQPRLPAGQFLRQLIAAAIRPVSAVFLPVDGVRLAEHLFDLT